MVLAEVAQAAGVTKGAAYHHFDNKAGLFRAVVREVQQELGERVATAAEGHEDLWEQLRAGCRAFLAAGRTRRCDRYCLSTRRPCWAGTSGGPWTKSPPPGTSRKP
ncbi:TetR/AcrR family transcriptional regulator [Streptomyces sp. NPDC058818]|uniref:TetR/AcrR family transcriptional regulator n=1 Tax=Streptomyces sp. NPDC058818 TaxID=3346640 RepID=UPI0036813FCB